MAPLGPLPPLVLPSGVPTPGATPTGVPTDTGYQLPEFARRSLAAVGPSDAAANGVPFAAFGDVDGRYAETLMRRLSAPLPSRWLAIALRRALTARTATPAQVNGADFAAERAWLLLRMGDAVAARAVAQAVDTDNITPKLRQVLMQTALATADPAGLCPLVAPGTPPPAERGYTVARAICAGLTGAGGVQPMIQDIRRRRVASGIDLQLAQKVIGAGIDTRQAITIEWDSVDQLTAWRWGLATATGVAVPDTLYATAGAQLTGWRALSPAIAPAGRASVVNAAAGMGVLSNAALVDYYAAAADDGDATPALSNDADQLRTAYVGESRQARLTAMKALWAPSASSPERYGRLVLTARACGRMAVFDGLEDADRFVASMLSAGLDGTAARWRDHVPSGGDAWAMIALTAPDATGRVSYGTIGDYSPGGSNAVRKQQLFFAALAGLGRLAPEDVERGAKAYDVRIGAETPWTRALDRAAAGGQAGTVLLLAAIGLQTPDWSGVPPETLYRITGALRAVGQTGTARMMAAEALARL